jgi:glucosamine--fructose-6-phosphate aminotransferase (isomerizing)
VARLQRVYLVSCGTSYHAALIGRSMVERLSGLPAEADLASEFRYRDAVVGPDTLIVAISQSGETADTLGAVKAARARGASVLGITNVVGSALAREADGVIYTHAGPEIGVASTKTFTATVTAAYLFAIALGLQRGFLTSRDAQKRLTELAELPALMAQALEGQAEVAALATRLAGHSNFLFLGRGLHHPVALEGALKLKEISYIHAEGYPAAEMKHGPIALIDEQTPSVVIAPSDSMYEKTLSNLQVVKARKGPIIAVATEGNKEIAGHADDVIYLPATIEPLCPLLSVIPLQLLAYHIAVERGCDVDKPRNLAKSVTVE